MNTNHLRTKNLAEKLEPRSEEHTSELQSQAEDGIRDSLVTGVQTCALPIC